MKGEGGQAQVYKCETDSEDSDLPAVVAKLYRRPSEVNSTVS